MRHVVGSDLSSYSNLTALFDSDWCPRASFECLQHELRNSETPRLHPDSSKLLNITFTCVTSLAGNPIVDYASNGLVLNQSIRRSRMKLSTTVPFTIARPSPLQDAIRGRASVFLGRSPRPLLANSIELHVPEQTSRHRDIQFHIKNNSDELHSTSIEYAEKDASSSRNSDHNRPRFARSMNVEERWPL